MLSRGRITTTRITYEQDGPRERYREYAKAEEDARLLSDVRQRERRESLGGTEVLEPMSNLEVGGGECEATDIVVEDEVYEPEPEIRISASSELNVEEQALRAQLENIQREEAEQNEFEVEAVLDRRVLRSSARLGDSERVEYLIKWKYWGDEHSTWERAENLGNCAELVSEFNRMSSAR